MFRRGCKADNRLSNASAPKPVDVGLPFVGRPQKRPGDERRRYNTAGPELRSAQRATRAVAIGQSSFTEGQKSAGFAAMRCVTSAG